MIQFDEHIFQMGWFNHQLEKQLNLLILGTFFLGDRRLFPKLAPLSGFRGIWRMWAPLKVEFLAGDLRVAM